MNYHILTLFPEMVLDGLNTSIIGRAAEKGLLSIEAVNIRDYTKEKHGHVDRYPLWRRRRHGDARRLRCAMPTRHCASVSASVHACFT